MKFSSFTCQPVRRRFALVAVAATLACGYGSAQAEVKAKLGHAMPDSHPQAEAMKQFADLASTYTNRNVQIKVFSGGLLGSDEKQLQAVQGGFQEFYMGTLAPLSTRIKEIQIWDLPFLFQNEREVYAVLDGPSSKKIFDKLPQSGMVGLTWSGLGFRNVSNSKHPINKADDIKGLKLRVMTNPVALETWKALDANATPMAFSEVYQALEMKAIDGQENPLLHMYSNKMQDVQKFVSITNHVYTPVALVASKKFWDTLSPQDQRGVQRAATEAGLQLRKLLDKENANVVGQFRTAGVTVNEVPAAELARMREKVQPVVDKFAPVIGEEYLKGVRAEIDRVRAAK